MSDQKDFKFDQRAASYDDGFEGRLSQRFYNLLLNQLELRDGMTVLDAGCGTGALLRAIARRTAIQGFGIDVEPAMTTQAKQKCPDMEIIQSGCESMPFEDHHFDVIVTCMAYHHFPDKDAFVKEAARVLKPGGMLYIADPYFAAVIRKPFNGLLRLFNVAGEFFTPQEIEARFAKAGFVPTGRARDGFAQVVQLRLEKA